MRSLFIPLLLLSLALLSTGLLERLGLGNSIQAELAMAGPEAYGLLITASLLFTACGGPRQLVAASFGLIFGGLTGTLLSTLVVLGSATAVFLLSRELLRPYLTGRFAHFLRQIEGYIADQPWLGVTMIRLLPFGSNLLTNIVAGMTQLRLRDFLVGSMLGYLPQMLLFSYVGAGLGEASRIDLGISVIALVFSAGIGWYLHTRHKVRTGVTPVTAEKD